MTRALTRRRFDTVRRQFGLQFYHATTHRGLSRSHNVVYATRSDRMTRESIYEVGQGVQPHE